MHVQIGLLNLTSLVQGSIEVFHKLDTNHGVGIFIHPRPGGKFAESSCRFHHLVICHTKATASLDSHSHHSVHIVKITCVSASRICYCIYSLLEIIIKHSSLIGVQVTHALIKGDNLEFGLDYAFLSILVAFTVFEHSGGGFFLELGGVYA